MRNCYNTSPRVRNLLWLTALVVGMVSRGQAAMFVVEPTNSVLTVSGTLTAFGSTYLIVSQAPGSLTSTLNGTIEATVAGGTITFDGGAAVAPILQPGTFLPFNAPAEFAGRVPELGAVGALRNNLLDFSSAALAVNGANEFDASSVVPNLLSGVFDFEVLGFLPAQTTNLAGTVTQAADLVGTVDIVGGQQRLMLPVSTSLVQSDGTFTLEMIIEGRILAFAPVPEPASMILAGMGAAGLMVVVRRRRQR